MTEQSYTVLVPLADPRAAADLIQIAAALIPAAHGLPTGRVVVLNVVEIPDELEFSRGAAPARQQRELLGQLRRLRNSPSVELRPLVRISRQIWEGVVEAAREECADLILFGWKGWTDSAHRIFGTTIDEVLRDPPCDIAVVKQRGLSPCKRILLPVRGGPHAILALKLALALAARFDASITALRVEPPDLAGAALEAARAEFEAVLATAPTAPQVRRVVRQDEQVLEAILAEAAAHDVVIMGAAAGQPDTPYLVGTLAEGVAQALERTTIIVKTRAPGEVSIAAEPAARPVPTPARSLSTRVDKWFAENTFHHREFSNVAELARRKRQQGLTISLGLPTLNEAETIGEIVRVMREELLVRHGLLDEIVVIDSGSTDDTVAIARRLGVAVVQHQSILPEMGSYRGKGEALWKSLHVLRGDIVCWIDTDIRDIHPRFVYGLLGPLLREPRLQYVKGFYRRPIRAGRRVLSTGGGRVTELTARPLLNLFYPELSGFVQPLSGEYAGRRAVLEQLPFFSGYGVEIALLIDLLALCGLEGLGQVDLELRIHRNQSLADLSKMAFTIIQVVMRRLEQQHHIQLLAELRRSMKLIHSDSGAYHLEVKELEDQERPPMLAVPAYRAARGLPPLPTPAFPDSPPAGPWRMAV